MSSVTFGISWKFTIVDKPNKKQIFLKHNNLPNIIIWQFNEGTACTWHL